MTSLYVLDINLLSEYCLPNISSHSINCSSVGDALLCSVKVLYCEWVPFIYFYFCFICLRRKIQKIILRLISKCLLPTFSSVMFMVSGFIFKSLNHVEFIFFACTWYEKVVQLNSFACNCTVSPILLIEEIDILYFILLLPWS